MKKFLVNLLCAFVPSQSVRHSIRAKLLKKNNSLDYYILQSKLDTCLDRLNFLENLIKATVSVSNFPAASGVLSLVQKSEVAILQHFSMVIKQYKLRWWLDSGTLIGHVRHNGFIPWDDDIDICMMRDDYEKLPEILSKSFATDGFFFRVGEIIRLYYKNLHVWVDIFPIDSGYQEELLKGEEYSNFVKIIDDIKSKTDFDYNKWLNHESPVSQNYLDTAFWQRDNELVPSKVDKGFLFLGVETGVKNRCLFKYDWIFPLKPVNWLGVDTFIPNRTDFYLTAMYGDYLSWPNNFNAAHGAFSAKITTDLLAEHQELISKFYGETS